MSSRTRRAPFVAVLIGLALAAPSHAAEKPSLLVLPPTAAKDAGLLTVTETELARSERYRLLLLPALLPLMREADERGRVRQRAQALVEEGRQLLMGLDHEKAKARLDTALQVLEQGFVRFYDPRSLAQVRLLLGIWALERARPDLARRELEEAHQLDPGLTLDAHYSPQVRAAFAEAKQGSAARPGVSAGELRKLLRLSAARAVVVLGVEPAGERALLRGAIFVAARDAYGGVESVLVDVRDARALERGAATLGAQLRRLAEPLYPAPASRPLLGKKDGPRPPPPPPPKKPWYRRWYTWAAAGIVVAGTVAVVLPLTIKREIVETTLRW